MAQKLLKIVPILNLPKVYLFVLLRLVYIPSVIWVVFLRRNTFSDHHYFERRRHGLIQENWELEVLNDKISAQRLFHRHILQSSELRKWATKGKNKFFVLKFLNVQRNNYPSDYLWFIFSFQKGAVSVKFKILRHFWIFHTACRNQTIVAVTIQMLKFV